MIIDFHSHILPGIDDGSKDLGTSLEMLKISKEQGIDYMVATPHFHATRISISHFLEAREEAYKCVSEHKGVIPLLCAYISCSLKQTDIVPNVPA